MTMYDAQQASRRSAVEVHAADINGDQLIDLAEFAALTVAPVAADIAGGRAELAGEQVRSAEGRMSSRYDIHDPVAQAGYRRPC